MAHVASWRSLGHAEEDGPRLDNNFCMPDARTYAWLFEDLQRAGKRTYSAALPYAGIKCEFRRIPGSTERRPPWLEITRIEVRPEWRRRGVATQYFKLLMRTLGLRGVGVRAVGPVTNADFAAWGASLVAAGIATARTVSVDTRTGGPRSARDILIVESTGAAARDVSCARATHDP